MRRVAIVLPIYNGERYLAQSIQSVLEQTFTDFELCVLDDGSTDSSLDVVRRFSDGRISLSRNQSHLGLFGTLNRAFDETTCPLIRLWAQDDVMPPHSLRAFVDFAERHPSAGMVYSNYQGIDADGRLTSSEERFRAQRARTPVVADELTSALLFWLYGCLPGNISAVLLRRDAWEKAGRFQVGLEQAPDFDMWCRVSERFDIGYISDPLVLLREHAQQQSRMGHRQTTTIAEELPVMLRLRERLSGVLDESELRQSWVVERGRQHVHWVARALLRGDYRAAVRGMRALAGYPWPVRQALFWALSLNGRLFLPSRDRLFDRCLARMPGRANPKPL